MRGEELVRMVPYKERQSQPRPFVRQGPLRVGLATHKDRILKPMIRAKVTDPWREVSWTKRSRTLCRNPSASRTSMA